MASNNKVDVTVRGKGNRGVVVGGTIGSLSSGDSANEIKVDLGGENNQIQVAGTDVIANVLEELAELLVTNLEKKSDKEFIREIVQQLNEQTLKSKDERNEPKIKRLLNNLANYIGFSGIAISQAERIKSLYNQVVNLFG